MDMVFNSRITRLDVIRGKVFQQFKEFGEIRRNVCLTRVPRARYTFNRNKIQFSDKQYHSAQCAASMQVDLYMNFTITVL